MGVTNKLWVGGGVLALLLLLAWYSSNKSQPMTPTDEAATNETSIPPATSESPAMVGTIWTLLRMGEEPVSGNITATVQFDDQGRLTGSDGCNNFSTSYTIDGSNLTIDPAMASTGMACDELVMSQADVFTQTLLATTGFVLGDGMLVLQQGGEDGLTFTGQSNSLAKTSWIVTGYNNGNQAVVSPIQETTLDVTFGDEGTISGTSGCNTYSGQYSLSGSAITISPLATTLRECIEPEGVMEQEQAFIAALQQAVEWNIQGNQLSLRTAEDALALTAISSLPEASL